MIEYVFMHINVTILTTMTPKRFLYLFVCFLLLEQRIIFLESHLVVPVDVRTETSLCTIIIIGYYTTFYDVVDYILFLCSINGIKIYFK